MRYTDKEEMILESVKGTRVLHLGCVGFADLTPEERVEKAKDTLHWKMSQVSQVVGIDYSAPVVEEYRRLKVFDNVVVGDVEKLDALELGGHFDYIVAGDIIEHLSNPGLMLEGLKRFCHSNTTMILTTPNAFGASSFVRFLFGRFREGAEHVMSFNSQNLSQLLRRHGWAVAELATCHQPAARSAWMFRVGKCLFQALPTLGGTLAVCAVLEHHRA